ncbi:L-alanine-DL-glutamate epimerase or related enzyme of enolase superfamily [Halanaeroarchaeum sp. HSR-CO]|uniref:mandelate racemase/muconate lactonizing enzyme family protein n=1 Tax=Halanaeroarchaeum sp. HSR-CO TaxID=2866382 RepID=UPI00217D07F5|nr:o-succinylbenzoate synthase [Halanaeroarchaeum sp. HSR-CO]UWG47931.1 L-alanine-DL-glutamate epimerase or related enzyme of enolase superfamily [Halanaeroarchaeum sp. HSR-CO]
MKTSLTPFELSLSTPLRTSAGRIDGRRGWVLRAGSDPMGFGEATPLAGFTEDRSSCERALHRAIDHVEDGDIPAAYESVTGTPAARNALSTALLDRDARHAGRPLYRELGAERAVERLPVQATIGDGDPTATAETARTAVDEGFQTLKIKVGAGSLDRDVSRLESVRMTVGTTVTIRVDANGSWGRATATDAIDRFREYDVALVEQPLPPADLVGHRNLRGRLPIALDESLLEASPESIFETAAADALVLKPMALGGPDVARAIAVRALENDIDVIVSNTIDGTIGRTAAVHLAASLPERTASGLATASMLETDLAPDPAPVSAGRIAVPQAPGIGITEVTIDA